MQDDPGQITVLLREWRSGDRTAESKLFELLMPDLRKIARNCFRGERPGHVLQPTALVNEAFLRLVKAKNIDWQHRGHFLALAARVMRRYLIDHARAQPSVLFLPMDGIPPLLLSRHTPLEFAIAIDTLLDELEQESQQRRAVVELKFFLGMTDEEIGEGLGIPLRTVQREWHRARRWLFEHLNKESWKAPSIVTSE